MSRLGDTITKRMEELKLSQKDLGDIVGMGQQGVSQIAKGEVAAPRKWREIAKALQIPEKDMRELMLEAGRQLTNPTKLPKSLVGALGRNRLSLSPVEASRRIPILGQAVGGSDGEYVFNGMAVDYTPCPPWLSDVEAAYAIYVDGESMMPRYRPGELVYVHPGRPARAGDDVVVQIDGGDGEGPPPRGFIKTYVSYQASKLVLEQYNPAQRIEFTRDQVVSVHTIVGRMG